MSKITRIDEDKALNLLVLFEQGDFDVFEIRDNHIYFLNQPKGNEHEGAVTSIDIMGNFAVTCGKD